MRKIEMVDLKSQTKKIKPLLKEAIDLVLDKSDFINGSSVRELEEKLENYLGVKHVIACANGTDALQLAFMALEMNEGDEVLVPSFTYVATAEILGLLKLRPVFVDVNPRTFNIDIDSMKNAITPKTRAIVPVHLFGQCAEMEEILNFSYKHKLFVIEDAAQAIGARYTFSNGQTSAAGTMGNIGTTSFFPSKNLGGFGDGGAVFTNDTALERKIRMIANHGQNKKYYHQLIGVNSRLDTLQAAILNVKFQFLQEYITLRNIAADFYDKNLADISEISLPKRSVESTHVFHQYTICIINGKKDRDMLKHFLAQQGIPTMIYYPLPLQEQEAYKLYSHNVQNLTTSQTLSKTVLSLPMHTELDIEQLQFIVTKIKLFFNE